MSDPVLAAGALPEGDAKRHAVEAMFDRLAPGYDRMNRIISLGQDTRWRRRTVDALGLARGSLVLDLACGTGDLCRDLAAAGYRAVGVDFSAGMLARARTTAPLVRGDAQALPLPRAVRSTASCAASRLRNFVDLDALFAECARVLRPGGRFAALDAAVPEHVVLARRQRRVVPGRGAGARAGARPRRRRVPLPPASRRPTSPRRARCSTGSARRGVRRRGPPHDDRWIGAAHHRDPGRDRARHCPPRRLRGGARADPPGRRRRRRHGRRSCTARSGRASRGSTTAAGFVTAGERRPRRRRRRGCGPRDASTSDDDVPRARHRARSRSGPCPSTPPPTASS